MEKEKVTIAIDEKIHRAAKYAALDQRLTLKEFVEHAINEQLYPRANVEHFDTAGTYADKSGTYQIVSTEQEETPDE